jgi:uridylate kinase
MFDMFEQYNQQDSKKTDDAPEPQSYSSDKKRFVLSVGGSILFGEKPNTSVISKLAQKINSLHAQGFKMAIVVGGGKVCRNYVASAKSIGANNFALDSLGIQLTRANAFLFIQALDNAFPKVLENVADAKEVIERGKIPVFGGLHPGITTDAVAALVAESIGAEFFNLTNVDGIYSHDPKAHPGAKRFSEIGYEKLISLVRLSESKPGQNIVLDLPCCLVLKRSSIRGVVLDGNELENLESALRGENFNGTVICEKNEKLSPSEIDSVDEIPRRMRRHSSKAKKILLPEENFSPDDIDRMHL